MWALFSSLEGNNIFYTLFQIALRMVSDSDHASCIRFKPFLKRHWHCGYIGERRTWSWSTRAFAQLWTTNSLDHILHCGFRTYFLGSSYKHHEYEFRAVTWEGTAFTDSSTIDCQFQFSSFYSIRLAIAQRGLCQWFESLDIYIYIYASEPRGCPSHLCRILKP